MTGPIRVPDDMFATLTPAERAVAVQVQRAMNRYLTDLPFRVRCDRVKDQFAVISGEPGSNFDLTSLLTGAAMALDAEDLASGRGSS